MGRNNLSAFVVAAGRLACAVACLLCLGCGGNAEPLSEREQLLIGEWDLALEQEVFHFYPDHVLIVDSPTVATIRHGHWKLEGDLFYMTFFERIEDGELKENLLKVDWVQTVRELSHDRFEFVPGTGRPNPSVRVRKLTKTSGIPSPELPARFQQ
jgi:hypothetical protein